MKINLKYFASLRDKVGKDEEVLSTDSKTPRDVLNEVNSLYRLEYSEDYLMVAINESYADYSTPLKDGDRLAFIPPVAGG